MNDLLGLALLLGVGLALYLAALSLYTAWTLTHPPRRTYASAVARSLPGDPGELDAPRPFEARALPGPRGPIPIWDLPADHPHGPTVVMTPGWADSRLGALARLPAVLPHARRVIAWDPHGLGDAPGACTLGTREVDALLALLAAECADEPVVLFGWSMGAGVSIAAAARRPQGIAGVIAEAPYRVPATPARGVLDARHLPHRVNLPLALTGLGTCFGVGPAWRGFDRATLAARLRCPLLVLHGTRDIICPIEDARAIAHAAPHGRLVETPEAGHNDLWTDPRWADRQAAAVGELLAGVRAPGPTIPA